MTSFKVAISVFILMIFGVWSASAQGECALDVSAIIDRVTDECANIGENEVCYGNRNVNVTPRINTIDFVFDSPGDLADLYNIQSLVVDAVNPQTDTWGVAQMRLLVGSTDGLQDVTMLLFGEFDIENAVPDTLTLELQVTTLQKIMYREPSTDSAQVGIVNSSDIVIALARSVDSSWLRVENPETRVVGWIENSDLRRLNEILSLGVLPIQDPQLPYFGAMQAFYFESGNTDLGCDTVESDGLLIQTPEGAARISLLINEVSIELVGGRNEQGENTSGTALVQANPLSGEGLSVDVLQGEASVRTDEGEQRIQAGQRSTIPLSVDLRSPIGAPATPVDIGNNQASVAPLLPAIDPDRSTNNTASNGGGNVTVNTTGGGSGSGSETGSGVGGVDIQLGGSNGAGGGNSTSSTGSNTESSNSLGNGSGSSSQGTTTGFSVETNNNDNDNEPNNMPSTFPAQEDDGEEIENIFQGLGQRSNIIALSLAVGAMVLFILFIIWTTRRQRAKQS